MQIIKIDPRALNDNPDDARKSKSSPQADALLLATVKAVGIIQPPVVSPAMDGDNGYTIQAGHRRVRQAIAAGLDEIEVLVSQAANDNGAMRSMIENIAREPLNPVDQWRGIERLVALDWTEGAIAVALALPVRQIRKLRLLANVLPAMLEQMAMGDMPNEQQLRTIAASSQDEQKEVWKSQKPKTGQPASWWQIANALTKTRMYARDASFGEDLAAAYGIEWVEDLFAPADEDSRHTTNSEAFLGAQQEWMINNLPKKGVIAETTQYGDVKLPPKAERVYGKPSKGDLTALFLDRAGKVQSVRFRMPEAKKPKPGTASDGTVVEDGKDTVVTSKPRPDVTQTGQDMIGDFRTDALRNALGRAPMEDGTLMALLILAFAGTNVRVDSGSNDLVMGGKRFARHGIRLLDEHGKLAFDRDTLRIAARSMLIDVLSCRRGMSNSGVVARIAGDAIGADSYLPNMGTEEFMLCLSRQALEASCKESSITPRQRVRDTRAALVEHFREGHFVHPAAHFAPDQAEIADLLKRGEQIEDDAEAPNREIGTQDQAGDVGHPADGAADDLDVSASDETTSAEHIPEEAETAYGIAAE